MNCSTSSTSTILDVPEVSFHFRIYRILSLPERSLRFLETDTRIPLTQVALPTSYSFLINTVRKTETCLHLTNGEQILNICLPAPFI